MKLFTLALLSTAFLSLSAQADVGTFTCQSPSQTIKFTTQEMSDIITETSTLTINKKVKSVSRIAVDQTDYGVLSIAVTVGTGPSQYRYRFSNLGSEKCLGVYGSKQTGSAYVDVFNSLGKIAKIDCKCDVD